MWEKSDGEDHQEVVELASILDENTREQALRTSQMPFVRPHLALMPDAHLGAGATVGSVIPTEGAIMPRRRRSRYRLRNDRGQNPVQRTRPSRPRPERTSPQHRTLRSALGRCLQQDAERHGENPHRRTRGNGGRSPGLLTTSSRTTGGFSSERWALVTTSSR